MSWGTVAFSFENWSRYPVKCNSLTIYHAEYNYWPASAPAFKTIDAGYYKAAMDISQWGALDLYTTPDPYFNLCVFFLAERYANGVAKQKNIVKTTFVPSSTQQVIDKFGAMYRSSWLGESAEHRYTSGDGKQHKLTVTASVDQEVNAHVSFRLQHFVWEKKEA